MIIMRNNNIISDDDESNCCVKCTVHGTMIITMIMINNDILGSAASSTALTEVSRVVGFRAKVCRRIRAYAMPLTLTLHTKSSRRSNDKDIYCYEKCLQYVRIVVHPLNM